MNTFSWIILSSVAMSCLSLVGIFSFFIKEGLLTKIIYPLVAFSAGALLGGAFFHMIPEALEDGGEYIGTFVWVMAGFSIFFLMEQFIHWHHCHKAPSEHKHPVTYLILIADGLHNFLDGLAIGTAFIIDTRLGIITWLVAAAHEIPQELGDFGILIHGGWSKGKALFFNFISALTMLLGGLLAYYASSSMNIIFLLPFAAGNFIYIASSDLIPEVKHNKNLRLNLLHFSCFILGLLMIFLLKESH